MIWDIYRALLVILLATPVFAGETSPVAPASPEAALAPADATAILYVDKPTDVLCLPMWETLVRGDEESAALLAAVKGLFAGPMMVSVTGTPMQLGEFRVEFACRMGTAEDEFFQKLDADVLPVLGRRLLGQATGGVTPYESLRLVRLPVPIPVGLFTGVKGDVLYGSTRRADVEAWLEGSELPERFVRSDDARRLFGEKPGRADVWAYLDLRPFVPLIRAELSKNQMTELYDALTLDRLEAAGASVDWSGGKLRSRVAVAMTEVNEAPPSVWSFANRTMEIPAVVPDDFHFFVRMAFDSGASEVDRLGVVLDAIDPDIMAEFREECREFCRDFGFDPHWDFMQNFVSEAVFAGRMDPQGLGAWVVATELADPGLFETHVGALAGAFALPFESWTHGGALIRMPPADANIPLAFACVDNYLVLATDGSVIEQVIDARASGKTVAAASRFLKLKRNLPAESCRSGYVDLAGLFKLANEMMTKCDDDNMPPVVRDLIKRVANSDATMGATLQSGPGVLVLDAVLDDTLDGAAREALWHSVSASLCASREQARRLVSAAKVSGIVQSCMIYANDHKGAWPESLGVLVQTGVCTPDLFRSPYEDDMIPLVAEMVDADGYYLYRSGQGLKPQDVVVCERRLRQGGANFGFADGHTEWIEGDRAVELLRMMEQDQR